MMLAYMVAGAKTALQYKGAILGSLVTAVVNILILSLLWSFVVGKDYLPYFTALTFLVTSRHPIWNEMITDFERYVHQGWSPIMTRGGDVFTYISLFVLGERLTFYLPNIVIGLVALTLMGVKVNLLNYLVMYLGFIVFAMAVTYLAAGISYLVTWVWGIRVMFNLMYTVFGGIFVPLDILPPAYLSFLDLLPFAHLGYHLVLASFGLEDPVPSLFVLLAWSVLFFVLGYPFHVIGRRRFESQGE